MAYDINARTKHYNPNNIPNIQLNQEIILYKGSKIAGRRRRATFEGKVISVNSYHFTAENKNGIKESFNYSEFITNDLYIKFKQ